MHCLICNRELSSVLPDDLPGHDHQPNDGTCWSTGGNYGSTVYDPVSQHQYLEAYVCDGCLNERQDRVFTVRPKAGREPTYLPGIHDSPESYAPFPEAIALLRKLDARPGCPICGVDGHRPECRLKKLLGMIDGMVERVEERRSFEQRLIQAVRHELPNVKTMDGTTVVERDGVVVRVGVVSEDRIWVAHPGSDQEQYAESVPDAIKLIASLLERSKRGS